MRTEAWTRSNPLEQMEGCCLFPRSGWIHKHVTLYSGPTDIFYSASLSALVVKGNYCFNLRGCIFEAQFLSNFAFTRYPKDPSVLLSLHYFEESWMGFWCNSDPKEIISMHFWSLNFELKAARLHSFIMPLRHRYMWMANLLAVSGRAVVSESWPSSTALRERRQWRHAVTRWSCGASIATPIAASSWAAPFVVARCIRTF